MMLLDHMNRSTSDLVVVSIMESIEKVQMGMIYCFGFHVIKVLQNL